MNYCLKSCFYHLLGHLLDGPASWYHQRREWVQKLLTTEFVGTRHQPVARQMVQSRTSILKRSYVVSSHKHSARVYVRPDSGRARGGAQVSNYARAAAAFLLDDDVRWLYTFLLDL